MLVASARGGIVAAVVCVLGCGAPSAPSPPPVAVRVTPAAASPYVFTVTAAPSCANGGQGTLFTRTFTFKLRLTRSASGALTFELPAGPQISVANSGDLTLEISGDAATNVGSLRGGGLSNDASHNVSFGMTGPPRSGDAALTIIGRGSAGELWGTMNGFVTMSIYRSSAGGHCTANGHTWQLIQEG